MWQPVLASLTLPWPTLLSPLLYFLPPQLPEPCYLLPLPHSPVFPEQKLDLSHVAHADADEHKAREVLLPVPWLEPGFRTAILTDKNALWALLPQAAYPSKVIRGCFAPLRIILLNPCKPFVKKSGQPLWVPLWEKCKEAEHWQNPEWPFCEQLRPSRLLHQRGSCQEFSRNLTFLCGTEGCTSTDWAQPTIWVWNAVIPFANLRWSLPLWALYLAF